MEQTHAYLAPMAGYKLWPNPHSMVTNGSRCNVCQAPFGPEGCFQVRSSEAQFHLHCLITHMIKKRQCPHCRSPFHPRLYLQFGLRNYMPKHWVYNRHNFPFALREYNGESIEWSWRYNYSKVELWYNHKDGEWKQSAEKILYAANELYPRKPPDHGLKQFFYQTLGWHWDANAHQIREGLNLPYFNASGFLAMTDGQLEQDAGDMPQQGDAEEELMYDVGYHRNRLKLAAIDAILHRISPETLRWLHGGPRPHRPIPLSLGSRSYLTCGTLRSIEAQASSSSQALPPQVLQWMEGLDQANPVAIDSDSD